MHIQGVLTGEWHYLQQTAPGSLSFSLNDPKLPRYSFLGKLFISCTRKAQFNKLTWIEYYTEQYNVPDSQSFIQKSHLKNFLFSKVKSWPVCY